mmetsp:Transcript_16854/g.47086  ORF Transcript_16854/g.47086 Transcript_16854/m.47086 type:complete len:100 (+) Transcript_16854:795-1094(+)
MGSSSACWQPRSMPVRSSSDLVILWSGLLAPGDDFGARRLLELVDALPALFFSTPEGTPERGLPFIVPGLKLPLRELCNRVQIPEQHLVSHKFSLKKPL